MFPTATTELLLVTPDVSLTKSLPSILEPLGLRVDSVSSEEAALERAALLSPQSILLLDSRLPGVASGQMLAALEDSGTHRVCIIALIADEVTEECVSRLREGVLDDIVPRDASASDWRTHLSTMRRGHQLYCELEHLRAASLLEVRQDRLTGAFNRHTMLSILFRETDRVQRMQGSLSLLLFDIDDFAHWNAELGAEACDSLLQQVVTRTGRALRSYDLLGRVGEDEFLLGLPGCSTGSAVALAERLRQEVFGELFPCTKATGGDTRVQLTGCYGIASSGGRSPVVVLREAEQALNFARNQGPDTIRTAGEMMASLIEPSPLYPLELMTVSGD